MMALMLAAHAVYHAGYCHFVFNGVPNAAAPTRDEAPPLPLLQGGAWRIALELLSSIWAFVKRVDRVWGFNSPCLMQLGQGFARELFEVKDPAVFSTGLHCCFLSGRAG